MEGTSPIERARLPFKKRGTGRYWTGFTVCLFIVLLSVFTWVIHRRLTQYESLHQAGGHHMTATKVCLTDRNQTLLSSAHELVGSGMLIVAVALAGSLFAGCDVPAKVTYRRQSRQIGDLRGSPYLSHFFFRPPPTLLLSV